MKIACGRNLLWIACWGLLATDVLGSDDHWPQWRGPWGTGATLKPTRRSNGASRRMSAGRRRCRGKGIPRDCVARFDFLTTAIPYGEALPPKYSTAPGTHDGVPVTQRHEFAVLCVNRKNGNIIWRKTVHKKLPHEGGHYTAAWRRTPP